MPRKSSRSSRQSGRRKQSAHYTPRRQVARVAAAPSAAEAETAPPTAAPGPSPSAAVQPAPARAPAPAASLLTSEQALRETQFIRRDLLRLTFTTLAVVAFMVLANILLG